MKKAVIIAIIASLGAGLLSCKQSSTTTCDVMCTAIFASVGVYVADANGNAVALDDHYTVRNGTGKIIRSQDIGYGGVYTVLDDTYIKKLQNTYASFTFVGVKNGVKVVERSYMIAADCCHVRKLSGADTVVVR